MKKLVLILLSGAILAGCSKPHTIEYFKKLISTYNDNLIFLEVWHNNIPLAMSIDIIYNNKLIYLYGVSSTENRNLLGFLT